MCHYCFDILLQELSSPAKQRHGSYHSSYSGLSSGSHSDDITTKPPFLDALPNELVECPLFVTWEKLSSRSSSSDQRLSTSTSSGSGISSGGGRHHHRNSNNSSSSSSKYELRGCIGTLVPKPLVTSIGEYAKISALHDKRFEPVCVDELPQLRVAVSLLVQYEDCQHCHDWTVGLHGIIIRFYTATTITAGGMELTATFLPEVAEQQGWDQKKTVASLIRKAGYKGIVTDTLLRNVSCTRYQSSKYRVTFDEYVQHLGHTGDPRKFITGIRIDGDETTASSLNTNNCLIM